MEIRIIFGIIVLVLVGSALLAVIESALGEVFDAAVRFVTETTERVATAAEAGCQWLRGQATRVIDEVRGSVFWGAAVAAAIWNLALTIAFGLAEYGLVLLTLRATGLSDQSSVLPLGAGFLTGLAFLACSVFFFEMILELLGVGNVSGIWHDGTPGVRRGLLALAIVCVLMVLAAGASLAALRGAEIDAIGGSQNALGGYRDALIIAATVAMSTAVFVALGLSTWSVIKSLLHFYVIAAVLIHGGLAGVILFLRLIRIVFERGVALVKSILAVFTAPWRRLIGWLARYDAIRKALRIGFGDSPARDATREPAESRSSDRAA